MNHDTIATSRHSKSCSRKGEVRFFLSNRDIITTFSGASGMLLSLAHVKRLLDELRTDGKTWLEGLNRGARWYARDPSEMAHQFDSETENEPKQRSHK